MVTIMMRKPGRVDYNAGHWVILKIRHSNNQLRIIVQNSASGHSEQARREDIDQVRRMTKFIRTIDEGLVSKVEKTKNGKRQGAAHQTQFARHQATVVAETGVLADMQTYMPEDTLADAIRKATGTAHSSAMVSTSLGPMAATTQMWQLGSTTGIRSSTQDEQLNSELAADGRLCLHAGAARRSSRKSHTTTVTVRCSIKGSKDETVREVSVSTADWPSITAADAVNQVSEDYICIEGVVATGQFMPVAGKGTEV